MERLKSELATYNERHARLRTEIRIRDRQIAELKSWIEDDDELKQASEKLAQIAAEEWAG
jgi:hypothetical protein